MLEPEIDTVLDAYLRCLEREVQQASAAEYRVHPGMPEAVLAGFAAGCAVGSGTGNVARGATIKLRRVGLDQHFEFGGFGDDHELRPALIRVGAQRGADRLGVALHEARVVIIGDTPKDVAAALAMGAECIGVGTGAHSPAALRSCGARWAFESLADPDAMHALLGGGSGEPEPDTNL